MAVSDSYWNSKIETFDDFFETERGTDYGVLTPFQFRDKNEPLLDWLVQMLDLNNRASQARMSTYRRNMDLYKGIHWKGDISTRRSPKQSVNFVYEMTEGKVSRLATNKVSFTAVPMHNEQTDVNNAKSAKLLLDSRCKEVNFDGLNTVFDRTMMQLGHAYFHVEWDRTAGGLAPLFKKVSDADPRVLKKIQSKLGSKDDIFIGDVTIDVIGANRVFPELGKMRLHQDVDYVDIVTEEHKDSIKARYPKVKEDVQTSTAEDRMWRINSDENRENFCTVHTFYHRKTKFLPEGRKIVWTRDAILEDGPLPFSHGKIPLVDDRDIEVYEEFYGRSNYGNIYNLQRMYNIIQSAQARDFTIASAPKWIYQKGSIRPTALNTELSGMEFTGPIAPKLVSHNPTSSQGFELQDRIESKISKLMAVFDMSRGNTPQGVTANSALRFLDEQESQRLSSTVANRNRRITGALTMMLSVMGDNYSVDDGRTIRGVGEDNSYLIRDLSKTDFSKVDSIELQKTSALPDTKAGKIATIIDLNQVTQTDPVFKREEIIEMLDLGLDKAFVNRSTVGINAARTALQDILEGKELPEPQMYDSLDIHYGVLTDALEENLFKQRVDPQIQEVIAKRVETIEGLMWIRAKNNIKFAQELASNSKYPIFFTPPIPVSQLAMMPVPQTGPSQDTSKIKTINQTQEQQ